MLKGRQPAPVAAGLIDFDLVPLKPYPGFARLFAEAAQGV
jgi:hypothetical protein